MSTREAIEKLEAILEIAETHDEYVLQLGELSFEDAIDELCEIGGAAITMTTIAIYAKAALAALDERTEAKA